MNYIAFQSVNGPFLAVDADNPILIGVGNTREEAMDNLKLQVINQRGYRVEVDEELETRKRTLSGFELTDRVKVVDGSNNIDKDTQKRRNGIDPLFKEAAVVVEKCWKKTIEESHSQLFGEKSWHYSDVLLLFPNGTQVYTSSNLCVKVTC